MCTFSYFCCPEVENEVMFRYHMILGYNHFSRLNSYDWIDRSSFYLLWVDLGNKSFRNMSHLLLVILCMFKILWKYPKLIKSLWNPLRAAFMLWHAAWRLSSVIIILLVKQFVKNKLIASMLRNWGCWNQYVEDLHTRLEINENILVRVFEFLNGWIN
jgi:hypothetical protein